MDVDGLMGEARRRKLLGSPAPRPNPVSELGGPRHVLAMLDRRVNPGVDGVTEFSDHSAKPGRYASADLRTLYDWDGIRLRRLDRTTLQPHNMGHS